MIVVIDNRDSFVFNLARHLRLLGVPVAVVPAHGTSLTDLGRLRPAAIVISPGPCTPAEAGCSIQAVKAFRGSVPILGVCLGHQAIAAALGGKIARAAAPMHGRTSDILHDSVNLFAGIPSPMTACRYHSLVVDRDSLPDSLVVTARDGSGTIMAIADESRGIHGVAPRPPRRPLRRRRGRPGVSRGPAPGRSPPRPGPRHDLLTRGPARRVPVTA
jgi:para-aminobenzoate synthetase component 2